MTMLDWIRLIRKELG